MVTNCALRGIACLILTAICGSSPVYADTPPCPALLDQELKSVQDGDRIHLCQAFAGKVLLIVNTASKCELGEQIDELESLHQELADAGFAVLGLHDQQRVTRPEEASGASGTTHCRLAATVEFPLLVSDAERRRSSDLIMQRLEQASGDKPDSNFHKYIVDRDGAVRASFAGAISPQAPEILELVKNLL